VAEPGTESASGTGSEPVADSVPDSVPESASWPESRAPRYRPTTASSTRPSSPAGGQK
jgi:hypothetical protein